MERWENQRDAQQERMTEEERRRSRRALRRKREQQRRRRLIAAAVVAVLVLGGGAVGIVHSILRDAQTANVRSLADSGQAGSDGRKGCRKTEQEMELIPQQMRAVQKPGRI